MVGALWTDAAAWGDVGVGGAGDAALGADAVGGVKMDYEVLGTGNDMLMVTCSGTAVRLD